MDTLSPLQTPTNATIFKDFFDCLVSLASTNHKDGHLQLARAVVEWIPKCVALTPVLVKSCDVAEEEGANENENTPGRKERESEPSDAEKSFAPMDSFLLYLSQLTTAVQFSGSVAEYTERRGVAGEDELLLDEEEAGEEGVAGGGAEEDESTAEDLVSVNFDYRVFA